MLVYKDVVSGDEMCTDAFAQSPVLDTEGNPVPGLFEIESRTITKGGDNIDIGCGGEFGGAEEEVNDTVEKVNNVIESFRLTEVPFGNKNEFKDWIKEYVRKVRSAHKEKGTPQEKIKEFMAQAPEMVKFLMGQFKEWQFYTGESMDSEAGMVFAYYKEEAPTPTFVYINFGLVEEKF
ncbi:unnamed protein product [Phaeothamnion confervicola]